MRFFYTSRAEVFERPLADERRASDGERFAVSPDTFHASTNPNAVADHIEICDPYLAESSRKNPYVCRWGGQPADCYDVWILLAVNIRPPGDTAIELWSTPVTLTVRRPKTRKADVAAVELRGPPVRSPISTLPRRSGTLLLEPVTTGDGRLLIVNSGDTLLYSVMSPSRAPCDARGWKKLAHLSKAHRDPRMARYGIARYPIRDAENRRIKPGRPLRGAYPWIDREGGHLFFTQANPPGLFYVDAEGETRVRFAVHNPPPRREIELSNATRFGMSYFGLWSQGKIVIPDTRVNSTDFHTGRRGYRPRVALYEDDPKGVEIERALIVDLNSPENQWGYAPSLRARSPRDVVWWVSGNNGMTSEVVFDEPLQNGTLIYSPMNASINNRRLSWRDGFDAGRGGYFKNPRIQNSAASQLLWRIPAFGTLTGARVEPISAGGSRAKGLWLDGATSRLDYEIPTQTRRELMEGVIWTTALWIDPRGGAARRRLLTFPDDTWVDLEGSRILVGDGRVERAVSLPPPLAPTSRRWSHLALVSHRDRTDLYLDGLRLDSVAGFFLRPGSGRLTVGRPPEIAGPGFRGWIDELRVVSGARGPEQICNDAYGTLRGLDPADHSLEFETAGLYPSSSHDEISALLKAAERPVWERYRCERERDGRHVCLAEWHRLDAGTPGCVGRSLRFPEGPLRHDAPRPDSRTNRTCLSCHAVGHATASLDVEEPLASGPAGSALHQDRRRQPSQAPLRLHGFVPRALLGAPGDLEAPADGLLLDPWLYPPTKEGGSD